MQGGGSVDEAVGTQLVFFDFLTPSFYRLQSYREISLRTKDRVYQAVVQSILLNGCQMWTMGVADEMMLAVFGNDTIRRILHMRRRDCVPTAELRRRLRLTSIPAQPVQRRLRWFGHAVRRPESGLSNDLLFPTPPRSWQKRTEGQLNTWTTTLKKGVESLSKL